MAVRALLVFVVGGRECRELDLFDFFRLSFRVAAEEGEYLRTIHKENSKAVV